MPAADAMLRDKAKVLQKFHGDQVKKHGGALRKELIASAKLATGGDRRLSGLGNTPTLGVTLRTKRGSRTTTGTLKPSPKAAAGPWRWIEEGTAAGQRVVRRSLRRRGRDGRPVGRSASSSYFHPGTSGSSAWSRPVEQMLPKIEAEIRRDLNAAMQ